MNGNVGLRVAGVVEAALSVLAGQSVGSDNDSNEYFAYFFGVTTDIGFDQA